MPPSVQAYLPGRDASKYAEDRDQVVSVTFDVDLGAPAHPQFLCMCFRNGFQLWEVQDHSESNNTQATRETQPLREVLSVRQGYTRLVKVLPSVCVPEGSVLYGQQPALAVVSGDEVGDANVLRIFSVKSHDYIHKLRFHGDVHNVVCNARWMIVVLKNQLLIHSLSDLSLSQTYSTFPSPTPSGVLALGPRWLAYASNQPLRADRNSAAPANTYGSPLLDVGVGVAGMAASGAKQLGEIGLRTLNSYLSSSPPTLAEPTEPAMDYAGSVIVRDMDTQQVLHHFRAHDAPLGIIKFDPSGLLLVTAAIDGRNINLFEVDPGVEPGRSTPAAPKHLYKLVRGVTSSTIQDIAFSVDTRWVAVTSTRGTAHLYPINADGSPASVETHVPSPAMNAAWPLYPLSASYAAVPSPPITVFAVARIRTSDGAASGGGGACESAAACVQFSLPAASTVYTQYPPAVSAVCMVSGDGVLARYQLRPFAMAEAETQSEALQLEMQCQGTLDICRRRTWAEQQCPAERMAFWATKPASQPAPMAGCMPEWVSHVEIYTHERGEDSVWASRRFKFKTFEPAQLPPDTASPHLRFEQLPCVQLGGAAEPSPDGCRGEDVEELEDYFVVQTCPKPGMVSMQPDGFGQPGQAQAGVYGGLPPALAGGSGKGKGDPAGAAPPLTKSRSMEIAGSAGSRDPVWGLGGRDEDIFAQKGG